jgi:hypothetical protein
MHNNIFQLSTSPIDADEFITESTFEFSEIDDFADYVREPDCDLSKAYDEFPFLGAMFTRDGDKLICKGCNEVFQAWHKAVCKETDKLSEEWLKDGMNTWRVGTLLKEPFTRDRFYLNEYCSYPMDSSEFLQYCANNLKEGDTLYLGGVLDFHW